MGKVVALKITPRLECSACGVTIEAGCDCGVGYIAVAEELKKRKEQTRQRTKRTRARQKAKQNQRSRSATEDKKNVTEVNDWIREMLEFHADYSNRVRNWVYTANLSEEDRVHLIGAIHQGGISLTELAQDVEEILQQRNSLVAE